MKGGSHVRLWARFLGGMRPKEIEDGLYLLVRKIYGENKIITGF